MDTIDYSKYTVEELEDVYRHIDRDKWPNRVKEIEQILHDPVKRQARINTEKYRKKIKEERAERTRKINEPLGYLVIFLVLGFLALFFGIVIYARTGQGLIINSIGERILFSGIFFCFAYLYFNKWRKGRGKRRRK